MSDFINHAPALIERVDFPPSRGRFWSLQFDMLGGTSPYPNGSSISKRLYLIHMNAYGLSLKTTPSGHIPLTADWPCLFQYIAYLPQAYVELRNSHGRMSMYLGHEELVASAKGDFSSNGLTFAADFEGWGLAAARVRTCPCCGAPGDLNIYNSRGQPFLVVNPTVKTSSHRWQTLLSEVAIDFEDMASVGAQSKDEVSMGGMPESGIDLGVDGSSVTEFLRHLAEADVCLEFTFFGPEAIARQTYEIQQLERSEGVLECRGPQAGFSIHTDAIDSAFASFEEGRMTASIVDKDFQPILKIRAGLNAGLETRFQSLLSR